MTRRRNRDGARLAIQSTEMMMAAPWVAALRIGRMLASGGTPNPRDQREFTRMGTEKMEAFGASWMAAVTAIASANCQFTSAAIRAWSDPANVWAWSGGTSAGRRPAGMLGPSPAQLQRAALAVMAQALAPVHRAAMANARRLGL